MARIRSIKQDFFLDEELAECEMAARILFEGLWVIADREGRLADRPQRIKPQILPYDDVDVDALLVQLADRNFIVRYEVDGKRYIQVRNFLKHQKPHPKEPESVIPPHEAVEKHLKPGKKIKSREEDGCTETNTEGSSGRNGSGSGSGSGSGDLGSVDNGDLGTSVNTHTDRKLVCVSKSKFSLEEIRKFAWASHRLDQRLTNEGSTVSPGIRNPDGWAVVAHRSGEFDGIIQEWVDNPEHFEVAS